MYRYLTVKESRRLPECGTYESYGVRIEELRGGAWEEAAYAADVSTDPAFAEELRRRFEQGRLAPVHLMDVLQNSI